jgi:hypothetical protein
MKERTPEKKKRKADVSIQMGNQLDWREMMENPWQPYSGWLNNNILPLLFYTTSPSSNIHPFPPSYPYMIFRLNA